MSTYAIAGLVCFLTLSAHAAIRKEAVEYEADGTALEGYLAYDDSIEVKRPGILVVPEWTGLAEHPKNSARRLAELGYVALVVDMYGEGKVTTDTAEAARLSSEVKKNPELLKARFNAARKKLEAHPMCDPERMAAIGYCFGGTVVLEMARMGTDLRGVVSFHGGLESNVPEDERHIRTKVLACQGADDPHAPPETVQAFENEMRKSGADWMLYIYGNAVHSFTNPAADSEGARYNEEAARRSWQAMKDFFDEILAK